MDDEEEERGRNQESKFKYCAGNIQNTDVQIIFFFILESQWEWYGTLGQSRTNLESVSKIIRSSALGQLRLL